MPVESGSSSAASVNASTDFTTPLAFRLRPICGDGVARLDLEDDLAVAGPGVVAR